MRATPEQALERDHWTIIVRGQIRDCLIARGEVHADHLAELGIPEPYRNVVGAQLGRLVKAGLVYEAERRPATASASHKRKSGVFKPTAKGAAKLTGVDVAPPDEGGQREDVGTPETRDVDPGENGFKRAATTSPPPDGLPWGMCWSWVPGEPAAYWRRDLTVAERQGTLG